MSLLRGLGVWVHMVIYTYLHWICEHVLGGATFGRVGKPRLQRVPRLPDVTIIRGFADEIGLPLTNLTKTEKTLDNPQRTE